MAFPTKGVIDDFNRSENPLSTGWSGPLVLGDNQLRANASKATSANPSWGNSYSDAVYGPDCEAGVTLNTGIDRGLVGIRIKDAGTSTPDGYLAYVYTPSNSFRISRMDNGVLTVLAGFAITWADGDKFGIEGIGSAIKGYIDDGGAGWSEVMSVIDSTYTDAGNFALWGRTNDAPRFDDFFGGTIAKGGNQSAAVMGL